MFTELFNIEQKKVFLKIAEDILTIDDGAIDVKEQKYLLQICSELRLLPKDKKEYSAKPISEIFNDEKVSRALLIECLFLAYSNSEYHEKQKKFIEDLFINLGLDQSIVMECTQYISNLISLRADLMQFIHRNNQDGDS